MIAVDRLEKHWARGRRQEHQDCRLCNEPSRLCECHRPRRARYYDELECLVRMFRLASVQVEPKLYFPPDHWL